MKNNHPAGGIEYNYMNHRRAFLGYTSGLTIEGGSQGGPMLERSLRCPAAQA